MEYIYKYVDKESGQPVYVGRAIDRNWPRRLDQHKRDEWYEFGKYDVYFYKVATRTDSESLEAHFISKYGTDQYNNKAKACWGELSFVDEVQWEKYDERTMLKDRSSLDVRYSIALQKINCIDTEVERLKHDLEILFNEISDIRAGEDRLRRASIREWFYSKYYIMLDAEGWANKEDLFWDYDDYYCEHKKDVYEFPDSEEFWDAMHEIRELHYAIKGDVLTHIITKEDWVKTAPTRKDAQILRKKED